MFIAQLVLSFRPLCLKAAVTDFVLAAVRRSLVLRHIPAKIQG